MHGTVEATQLPPRNPRFVYREAHEKRLLAQRREHFVRHGRDNGDNVIATMMAPVVVPIQNTPAALTDVERLSRSSAAAVAKQNRTDALMKQQQLIEHKRMSLLEAEQNRWQRRRQADEEEQQRLHQLQLTNKAKKNQESLPYNPIALAYVPSVAGLALMHNDNKIKHRALQRMALMASRSSSSVNPITGLPNPTIIVPPRPATPPPLKQQQQQQQLQLQQKGAQLQ